MSDRMYSVNSVFSNEHMYTPEDINKVLPEVDFVKLFNELKSDISPTDVLYESFSKIDYLKYLSEDFKEKKSNKNSVINFVRYLQQVSYFISNRTTLIDINNKGQILLSFQCSNKSMTRLDLVFNENGKVDFVSLDKEYDIKEKKTFVLRGSIETSDIFSKSYKIQRLLVMLKYLDIYEDFMVKGSFNFHSRVKETKTHYSKKKYITTREYFIRDIK